MQKILMIAYHFPPVMGSSGVQRTLRFARHLPTFGWLPIVLTVRPNAYERVNSDSLSEIGSEVIVERAFCLDVAKHLSICGKYFRWMALPDRWWTWRFDGVRRGLRLIQQYKPSVIWSTHPYPSAHLIANILQIKTNIPWIADFRDPLVSDTYPHGPLTRWSWQKIEENVYKHASMAIYTTEAAAEYYRKKYSLSACRIEVIENGYDEESFIHLNISESKPLNQGAITLLHSGVVYPKERNPAHLFLALSRLKNKEAFAPGRFYIRFRAAEHDNFLPGLAREFGVEDYVQLCPPLSYMSALKEMLAADGLLILQGSECNAQVPAKIYEYLRADRPILALTDPMGETVKVLAKAGIHHSARLDSVDEITQVLVNFIEKPEQFMVRNHEFVRSVSRLEGTKRLVDLISLLNHKK